MRGAQTFLSLELVDQEEARALFGPRDRNLRLLRERFGVDIVARGGQLKVGGDEARARAALAAIDELLAELRGGATITAEKIEEIAARAAPAEARGSRAPAAAGALPTLDGVRLKTAGQRRYVEAIERHDVVFSIGPAGTGKTFLAVLMAVRALKRELVSRIVLTRPAVEAGEKLGYLPGDLAAKVDPYLRPLFDALSELLDFETRQRYLERGVIEIAPLAYMRGRTLNRSFVILDEAQNTTKAQMKMFLTRMGEGSKVVVTGDVTQIDLPPKQKSGLVHAVDILEGVEGISVQRLTTKDIVRHPIVWRIVHAYEGKPTDRQEG
jgi:phosphate starvation-inducible PhoH-like protein